MKHLLKNLMTYGIASTLFVACGTGQNNSQTVQQEPEKKIEHISDGALIKGKFSVAKGKKVHFSQGNLQYQASTNTWRFAEHQYDVVGRKNNEKISPTSKEWIDLFAWGTSGWESGAKEYQPYATSLKESDYYPGGSYKNNLTGKYANADWGVFNAISNGGDKAGLWRTLTQKEWDYLLTKRPQAAKLYSRACVNEMNGLILLPDNWEMPESMSFTPKATDWETNIYTEDEWFKMESNGAVFLPNGGYRTAIFGKVANSVYYVKEYGYYWSSSSKDASNARCLWVDRNGTGAKASEACQTFGIGVRLVQDCK